MHPLDQMEVFIQVVRQGSYSAAARRLGLASSVIADRVAGLEKRLGVRLLTRTTRRQALTEAGTAYFEEACGILAALTAMEQRVTDIAESSAGSLRVTAPVPIGRRWIAPFVGDFARRHPAIQVHLTLDDRFADIVGEGFDIAIRGGPLVESSLTGRRLFETRRVVVASPGYLERRGEPATPDELGAHACLVFNTNPHFNAEWRFGRGSSARNIRVTGLLAATNSELPVVWALAGCGLTQKSWWEVADHVRAGRLVVVLGEHEPDPVSFFAIHPVSRAQSRKIDLFINELIPALREIPA